MQGTLGPENFPTGLSNAPVVLRTKSTTHDMQFIAGFVGAHQDETTLAIRPEIGWAVTTAESPQPSDPSR